MVPVPGRVDDGRGYKDNQVLSPDLAGFAAEQPTDKRQVTKDGHLVFELGHILDDEPAEDNGLTIPNDSGGGYLTNPEMRQRQHGRERQRRTTDATDGLRLRHKCARVVVTEELSNGGNDRHLDREPISGGGRDHVKGGCEGACRQRIGNGGTNSAAATT